MSALLSNPTLGEHHGAAARAAARLGRLTLRRKIAQLVMPRIAGGYLPLDGPEHEQLGYWAGELGVGGVLVGMGPPLEIAARLDAVQALAELPLLVAADVESGPGRILAGGVLLPHRLENGGGTRFPPLMALAATGDESLAHELGRVTALECRAVGIHVAFAPVADVNSNPRNPIINTRSYGADAAQVARFVVAHVRGLQDHGMIATAKHFPGHGAAETDSHLALPCIDADAARLHALELVPFRAAIAAGVAGVMTAHIAVPRITNDHVPATLQPRIVTTLLRGELGFDGLVFSDALDMHAVTRGRDSRTACVQALRAGVDVLVQVPPDEITACIDAVAAAVDDGVLAEARIDDAAARVLCAKERLGVLDGARVALHDVPRVVGAAAHVAAAAAAAERSITVVRDAQALLPLRTATLTVLLHTAEYDPLAGRAFVAELERHIEDVIVGDVHDAAASAAPDGTPVVLAVFSRAGVGVDARALDERVVAAAATLGAPAPVIVISFGSPYHLAHFPDAAAHVAAWAAWEPMQTAAARVLCGRVAAAGRLPVAVPPLYEAGAGGCTHAEHAR